MRLNNRAVALHSGIAVIVVLCAGCARNETTRAGVADIRTEAVQTAFDSGAWKSGIGGIRGRMANDLVERQLLLGKTRPEVIRLLGAPDQEGAGSLDYFVYFGADHALGPASVIRVEFDPHADVVTEARLDTETGQGYSGAD